MEKDKDLTPAKVAKHMVDILGSPKKAREYLESSFAKVKKQWEQDPVEIGRILRSHLFVEHYLTEYLAHANPKLGSLYDARITFAQKITLLGKGRAGFNALIPGIKRLNAIRNRIAHSLKAEVTIEDAKIFLAIKQFNSLRERLAKGKKLSNNPIDILEDFARDAGTTFQIAADDLVDKVLEKITKN